MTALATALTMLAAVLSGVAYRHWRGNAIAMLLARSPAPR
jgi:hypothetical protein